jgi:hypothetical protein
LEFGFVPLGQTAGDDDFFVGVTRAGIKNGVEAFFFGALDEAAGVDDDDVGVVGVTGTAETRTFQAGNHHFRVHLVFGAPVVV